jgi:hypothetical protein
MLSLVSKKRIIGSCRIKNETKTAPTFYASSRRYLIESSKGLVPYLILRVQESPESSWVESIEELNLDEREDTAR